MAKDPSITGHIGQLVNGIATVQPYNLNPSATEALLISSNAGVAPTPQDGTAQVSEGGQVAVVGVESDAISFPSIVPNQGVVTSVTESVVSDPGTGLQTAGQSVLVNSHLVTFATH